MNTVRRRVSKLLAVWCSKAVAVALGGFCLSSAGQPAITPLSFPPSGIGPITFDTRPGLTNGWSTRVLAGANTDILNPAQMDAAVQTNTAAMITNALPVDANAMPPHTSGGSYAFRWNSARQFIESRPTATAYAELLLTLQNDSGSDKSTIGIHYDFGVDLGSGQQDVEDDGLYGYRVYYSLTGATGSWVHIPELDTEGPLGATNKYAAIYLPAAWEAGAFLYFLWIDDNGASAGNSPGTVLTEGPYTIDNLTISLVDPPPRLCCLHPITIEQCRDTNFSIIALGSGLNYQWFKNGNAIKDATNLTLLIASAQAADQGSYFARAYSRLGSVESDHVTLTVVADTDQPTVASATARLDGTNILVVFSEKMDPTAASDPSAYHLHSFSGGGDIDAIDASLSGDGKTVLVSFERARIANANYQLLIDADMADACTAGNAPDSRNMLTGFTDPDTGQIIAPLKYEISLISFEDAPWKYNHEGHDLTWPGWHQRGYDDSGWSNGVSVFDAKSTPRTVVDGMQVQTQLPLRYASFVDSNVPCYFFRGHFKLAGPVSAVSELHLRTFVDDFDAAWMNDNSVPIHTNPGNPLTDLRTYGYSGGTAVGDAAILGPFSVDPTNLVEGDNLVCVKVFQQAGTSWDITFAYELVAVTDLLPELSISLSGGIVTVIWSNPSAVLYEASVPDAESSAWRPVAGVGEGSYSFDAAGAGGPRFYTLRR